MTKYSTELSEVYVRNHGIAHVRNGDVWLKIMVTYMMLKMICIPSETNDYGKAKAYIIQMAFHGNKT